MFWLYTAKTARELADWGTRGTPEDSQKETEETTKTADVSEQSGDILEECRLSVVIHGPGMHDRVGSGEESTCACNEPVDAVAWHYPHLERYPQRQS